MVNSLLAKWDILIGDEVECSRVARKGSGVRVPPGAPTNGAGNRMGLKSTSFAIWGSHAAVGASCNDHNNLASRISSHTHINEIHNIEIIYFIFTWRPGVHTFLRWFIGDFTLTPQYKLN